MNLEKPRFVDGKPMFIAGLDQRFAFDNTSAIPGLWARFGPHIGKVPGQIGHVTYGLCYEMDGAAFQYLAGVEVADASNLPSGFTSIQVPAQRYAVFSHRDHVSKLSETMGAILEQWLPKSGHEAVGSAVMFERYGDTFDPNTGKGDVEVWAPIKS